MEGILFLQFLQLAILVGCQNQHLRGQHRLHVTESHSHWHHSSRHYVHSDFDSTLPLESSLCFLAIGDWGESNPQQKAVARQMALQAREKRCKFVVSTGDNFYDTGVKSVNDPLFKLVFEEPFNDPALQIPWYAVLGNHDLLGNTSAQVYYSQYSNRWHVSEHGYSVVVPFGLNSVKSKLQLFLLNTNGADPENVQEVCGLHHITDMQGCIQKMRSHWDAQVKWLQSHLSTSTALIKVVVGHHPIFSDNNPKHPPLIKLRQDVQPLLEKYGVQLYLSGHVHHLAHHHNQDVNYITTGTGSRTIESLSRVPQSKFQKSINGFTLHQVTNASMHVFFYNFDGGLENEVQIPLKPMPPISGNPNRHAPIVENAEGSEDDDIEIEDIM